MDRKQESRKKQIELLERSLADLEIQIAMLQPTPPVHLLRQKDHLQEEIKKVRGKAIKGDESLLGKEEVGESSMPETQHSENFIPLVDTIIDAEDKLKEEFQEEATILFSDLVGYTKRGENWSNPQIVVYLRRLERIICPLCESFNGKIVKTIGDAYMLKFKEANLAVTFAIKLQEELREYNQDPHNLPPEQISERIGVNTGVVIKDDKDDYFGDVVNVASRLQGAANPNGILIGEATYNELSRKNQRYFIKLPSPIRIKNHAPVTAYVYSPAGTIPDGVKIDDEPIDERELSCLMNIQEALAADPSVEPDPFRPGQLYWPDIKGLYKRAECDQIIQKMEKERVVLIEGYSASGKSSLVSRIGYELVNRRETVYYRNLTTQRGLNKRPEELVQELIKESRQIKAKVYLILEDLHQALQEMDRLNPLTDNPHLRLILTSRPLARYEIESYRGKKQGGMSGSFQWIAPQNRLELKANETLIEAIIREKGLPCKGVESVMEIIGKKEPNLLLLSFLIQVARGARKRVDEVKREEIVSSVRNHLDEIRDRLRGQIEDFWKIMGMISTLSEYEIPLETGFILDRLAPANINPLLEALKREKEILSLKGKAIDQEYLFLPHARLASLYREVCFSGEERQELLKDYLLSGEFFGRLTGKIRWENLKLLADLIESCRKELTSRDLSKASLKEIGDFLWEISWVSKALAQTIAEKHQEILKDRFSTAPLKEIRDFLGGISSANKEVARAIVERHQETLKGRDLSTAGLEEIGYFLVRVSWTNEKVAKDIVERHQKTLKDKFSTASPKEIRDFFERISRPNEEMARDIAERHQKTLKDKFSTASLEEIVSFLVRISRANEALAQGIIWAQEKVLRRRGYFRLYAGRIL